MRKSVKYDSVIFISDVHYGLKGGGDNSLKYLDWMDRMDGYFKEFFIPLIEDVKTRKWLNPCVVVAGDFFDNRISLRIDIINRSLDIMKEISKHVDVYMIVGNHDSYHKETTKVNSIRMFASDNVFVYDEPVTLEFPNLKIDSLDGVFKMDLVPWVEKGSDLTSIIKNSSSDVIVLHADINGMKYPNGSKVTDGAEIRSYKGKHIFSGHIHLRQESKKVTYFGSPYELDLSDKGNVKGIYVMHGGENLTTEFIENTYSPRHLSYTLGEVYKMSDDDKAKLKNNFVSVSYTEDEKVAAQEFERKRSDIGVSDLKMVYIEPVVSDNEVPVDISINTSDDDTIVEYISKLQGISEDDKKTLIETHKQYSEVHASK